MIRGKKISQNKLSQYLRFLLLITLGVNIFLIQACVSGSGSTSSTSENSIYWIQQDNRFMTNDVNRAQAEIPFPLKLPIFFPSNEKVFLVQIEGPIRQIWESDKIDVSINYSLQPSRGAILIDECNRPILPPDPKVYPEYQYMEIGGKEVVKTEGNFLFGKGVIYYFNLDGIYFVVEIDNLSSEDSVQIIESMISQTK
jgi:hypothetical protein